MKFCTECGFQNDDLAKFCKNCGAKIASETQQTTSAVSHGLKSAAPATPPPPSSPRVSAAFDPTQFEIWRKLQPRYQVKTSNDLAQAMRDSGVPNEFMLPLMDALDQGGFEGFYTVMGGAVTADIEVHLLDTTVEQQVFDLLPYDVLQSLVKRVQEAMYSATDLALKSRLNRQLAVMAGGVFEIRVRADRANGLEEKIKLTRIYLEVAREIIRRSR
jgi:hypothetical protein